MANVTCCARLGGVHSARSHRALHHARVEDRVRRVFGRECTAVGAPQHLAVDMKMPSPVDSSSRFSCAVQPPLGARGPGAGAIDVKESGWPMAP